MSRLYAPKAAAAGCVVIDNTSEFRYDDDIPLVVPEVNPEAIKQFTQRRIIANPNCSTIQMLVALKPLHDAARIERINVATYQSVSGAGKEAVDELAEQTVALMSGKGPVKPKVVAAQIAFNVVPQIDKFQDNGYTKEEMKMFWETRKIFADPDIKVNATTVRVPVFFGHSEVVNIETARKLTVPEARKLLEAAPGVKVIDMSVMISGPLSAMMLADQGADVIKVESPGIGDMMRFLGSQKGGETGIFALHNRGKRSIGVNLKSDEGRDVLRRLLSDADVLIQNFRPGALEKLGFGYDDVRKFNDRIVYDRSGWQPVHDNDEGDRIADLLGDRTIMVMAHHGVTTVGRTVHEAFDECFIAERNARIQMIAWQTGRKMATLPDQARRRFNGPWSERASRSFPSRVGKRRSESRAGPSGSSATWVRRISTSSRGRPMRCRWPVFVVFMTSCRSVWLRRTSSTPSSHRTSVLGP